MSDFHCVAFVVLRDETRRLLLARRSGVSYADGLWGLPGGHVEHGESLAAAAARETLEEVGVRIEPDALTPLGVIRYDEDGMAGLDVFFLCERFEGEPRPITECDAVAWCAVDDLPGGVVPWLPTALQRLLVEGEWFTDLVGTSLPD